jgi:hypothetical protein
MPMLDEAEYAEVLDLYREGMQATKEFRQRFGLPLDQCNLEERFRPVREAYERMTGYKETNHLAILHHRLAKYGPPCKSCGKPLRTPQAKLCGACMTPVDRSGN